MTDTLPRNAAATANSRVALYDALLTLKTRDEVDAHLGAVEIKVVPTDGVGLNPPLGPRELGVGADGHRRGQRLPLDHEPPGIDPVRRDRGATLVIKHQNSTGAMLTSWQGKPELIFVGDNGQSHYVRPSTPSALPLASSLPKHSQSRMYGKDFQGMEHGRE